MLFQEGNFVRRAGDREAVKQNGTVLWSAFKNTNKERATPGGGASWTMSDSAMVSDRCKAYHLYVSKDGKSPALCYLTSTQLETAKLFPRHDPELGDPKYGHLHYLTDCVDHQDLNERARLLILAHLASQNGLLQPYQDHRGTRPSDWTTAVPGSLGKP